MGISIGVLTLTAGLLVLQLQHYRYGLASAGHVASPLPCSRSPKLDCIEFDDDPIPEPYDDVPKFADNVTYWDEHKIVSSVKIKEEEGIKGAFKTEPAKMFRFFERQDVAGVHETYEDTSFKVVEWPGPVTIQRTYDTDSRKTHPTYQETIARIHNEGKTVVPFTWEEPITKFISYPCNLFQGLHIRALAYRRNPNSVSATSPSSDEDPYNPLYISLGDFSLHRDYIHPLLVSLEILNEMVKEHDDPECMPVVDTPFVPRTSKINVVHDFTFTNDRLLLGMHCGILVVENIDTVNIHYDPAKLEPHPDLAYGRGLSRDTYDYVVRPVSSVKQQFSNINIISATACCSQDARCADFKPLAVAYSYDQDSVGDEVKLVYISQNFGHSFRRKVIATSSSYTVLNLVRSMYADVDEIEPFWVSEGIAKVKAREMDAFLEEDPIVEFISQRKALNETKINVTRDSCVQIVAIEVVGEENSFVGLCRMTDGIKNSEYDSVPQPSDTPSGKSLHRIYGIFDFPIAHSSPIITPQRKTKRRLACNLRETQDPDGKYAYYEPDMIRTPFSFNIFVIGCQYVVYHSVNGGHTFWNLVWYLRGEGDTFYRHVFNPDLNYPLIAFSPDGETLTFAYEDKYAYGLINYNREFRLVCGTIVKTTGVITEEGKKAGTECYNRALIFPDCKDVKPTCKIRPPKFDAQDECYHYWITIIQFSSPTKFLPFFSNSGQPFFALNIMGMLKADPGNPQYPLYKSRDSVRLLDFPIQVTRDMLPLFRENTEIKGKNSVYGFKQCPTYSFNVKPRALSLDLGETGIIEVGVEDKDPSLPLGIFSSQSKLLQISVKPSNRSVGLKNEVIRHDWDVIVTAVGELKDPVDVRADALFGGEYSKYIEVSAHIVMTTSPQIRCHVQPSGSVFADLGCSNKVLVAHENYSRPHCRKFFDAYTMRLEEGEYDYELISYWLNEGPQYYSQIGTTMQIVYPYQLFGCPVEPYRLDPFEPDLRVIDLLVMRNVSDTELGLPYNRSYILVEIHGTKGYTYTKTVREAGCVRPPQTLAMMTGEWKKRLRVIQNALDKYPDFNIETAQHPENIWNQVNYVPCTERGDFQGELSESILNSRYEVMKRGSGNMLEFRPDQHKELYIFLAVDVDPAGTFCEFTRIFAIYINAHKDSPDLISFLRFLLFFLLALLFILLLYFICRRKVRVEYRERALVRRLEAAAWQLLYRYEKLNYDLAMEAQYKKSEMKRGGSIRAKKPSAIKTRASKGKTSKAGTRRPTEK